MYELILLPILLGGAAVLAHVHQRPPERFSLVTPGSTTMADRNNHLLTSADLVFVDKAAKAGIYGLLLGALGIEKAQDCHVREFAEKMVQENQRINIELTSIIQDKSIRMEKALDLDHRNILQQLAQESGSDFERNFLRAACARYDQVLQIFDWEMQAGNDKDLMKLASDSMPILRNQIKTIRQAVSTADIRPFRKNADLHRSA